MAPRAVADFAAIADDSVYGSRAVLVDGMILINTVRPSGQQHLGEMPCPEAGSVKGPLVSCLMVTHGDRPAVREAIHCYRQQTYSNRELVIIVTTEDNLVEPLLAELRDASIRLCRVAPAPLGVLRNASVGEARGALLCLWDDDDLCHPQRIELQLTALNESGAAASFLLRWVLWHLPRQRLALSGNRLWEGTMLIWKEAMVPYPPLARGEDTVLVNELGGRYSLVAIDAPLLYCYVGDGANTWSADHFDVLISEASELFLGEDYYRVLTELSRAMPVLSRAERWRRYCHYAHGSQPRAD